MFSLGGRQTNGPVGITTHHKNRQSMKASETSAAHGVTRSVPTNDQGPSVCQNWQSHLNSNSEPLGSLLIVTAEVATSS